MTDAYYTPEEMALRAKKVYNDKKSERDKFRDRCYEFAKLTLPYIMPDSSTDTSTETLSPGLSSDGAMGVNTASNKYMMRMFPVNRNYCKLSPSLEAKEQLEGSFGAAGLLKVLSTVESRITKHLNVIRARPALLEILKHLMITGNSIMYLPKEGKLQSFGLDEYVCERTSDGDFLMICILESIYLRTLPDEVQNRLISEMDVDPEEVPTKKVDLYTYIEKVDIDTFRMVQSVEDVYTGVTFDYNEDNLRWRPLVWHRYRKENYGRGLTEDIFNELFKLHTFYEIYATAAAVSADIKYFAKPGSQINIEEVNNSESGTWHNGDPEQVGTLQVNKTTDLQITGSLIQDSKRIIGKAFLMLTNVMRDAERVTAEENRILAQELDAAHGGVFTTLSIDLQLALTKMILSDLDLTDVLDSGIDIVITTGIDAIGREVDAEKALQFVNDMGILNNTNPEVLKRIKLSDFLGYIGYNRDVPIDQFLYSEEEVAQTDNQNADMDAQRQAVSRGQGQPLPQQPQ